MSKQKYGIIYYPYTANLGDDIQTYAASKFYPRIDYHIDRECISSFVPNKKESVKTIMNGWYNHDKTQFLISPYIDPLFESIHFSENDLILKPGYAFLDGYAKEILSKYKIGCRDNTTLNILKEKKYKDVYFSSCLTTTINPINKQKKKDYIVVVDMNPKIVEHLRSITDMEIIETTHWLFLDNKMSYEEKLKRIDEYDKASTEKRNKIVEKHAKLPFEKRMKLVEKQLELYQNAKLVITDRIHVGLPCLGLNTNVLLIYYDYNGDRVGTFKDFLTNCSEEEFLNITEEELLNVKNSDHYLKYREELIKNTKKFMEEDSKKKNLPDIESYKEFLKREKYLRSLYIEKIDSQNEKIAELEKKVNDKDIEFYNRVKHSRSWKIIKKFYEIRSKGKTN